MSARACNARWTVNPTALPAEQPYPQRLRDIIGRPATAEARRVITSWPGYAPSPLIALPGMARELDLAACYIKDESTRWTLKSFKALGGAYAVGEVLKSPPASATVCCATDGNHGRAVAWGAQRLGARCVIFLHEGVSTNRELEIRHFGAQIVRVTGNYDDSVRAAAEAAHRNGWIVVSDTSYEGYRPHSKDIPRLVMQGYTVLVSEALEQMPAGGRFTHVVIQGGVGGLAAAVAGHLWDLLQSARPRIMIVEPDRAACLLASARAGRPTAWPGPLDTIMAGLSCGEVSGLAWEILSQAANCFIAVPDAAAVAAMQALASGEWGTRVVSGESGAAGAAGLEAIAHDPELRAAMALDASSRVLLISTEGDTDPDLYRELVGARADEIRQAQYF